MLGMTVAYHFELAEILVGNSLSGSTYQRRATPKTFGFQATIYLTLLRDF